MILRHSQKPRPDPVHVPTPRTPVTAYAYCEDCGADAGSACVDENLRPCSLCPGRVLASRSADKRDSLQRTCAKPVPKPTTCTACGITIRRGGFYCRATACQRARKAAQRVVKPQALTRPSRAKVAPCWWCKAELPLSGNAGGRFAMCDRPCCGDHACKRAIKRDRMERERATPPANSPA